MAYFGHFGCISNNGCILGALAMALQEERQHNRQQTAGVDEPQQSEDIVLANMEVASAGTDAGEGAIWEYQEYGRWWTEMPDILEMSTSGT